MQVLRYGTKVTISLCILPCTKVKLRTKYNILIKDDITNKDNILILKQGYIFWPARKIVPPPLSKFFPDFWDFHY